MNLIKLRYVYFGISLLVIIPGIIALILWGLPLGIDFTGGSLLQVKFDSGKPPAITDVSALYNEFSTPGSTLYIKGLDIKNPTVQPLGTDSLSI